jgi:hypothetical protein
VKQPATRGGVERGAGGRPTGVVRAQQATSGLESGGTSPFEAMEIASGRGVGSCLGVAV